MKGFDNDEKVRRRPIYSFNVAEDYKDDTVQEMTTRKLMEGFVECTTMHGLPSAYNSYGYLKKIIWVIITLVMSGLCINNVYLVVYTFFQWNVDTGIQITSAKKIYFPAVSVCNINPLRKSVTPANILEIISQTNISNEVHDSGPGKFGTGTGLGSTRSDTLDKQDIISQLLIQEPFSARTSYGYQRMDFILSCTYEGYDCTDQRLWTNFWNWKYGNCFTFNANPYSNITELESHRSGPDYGLQLVLNTDQSDYLESMVDKAGAKIMIHDSTEMPFPDEVGYNLAPGFSTSLGLRKTDIARKGNQYGDCLDSTGSYIDLNIFEEIYTYTNYSLKACQLTCYQKMVIDSCGCFDARYPERGQAFTTIATAPCLTKNQTQSNCKDEVQDLYIKDTSCPMCNEPCNQTLYQATLSSALWPSKSYLPSYLNSLTHASTSIQLMKNQTLDPYENLMQVEVYYEELNYELIVETPSEDLGTLSSDIGGAFGLWIGASLVSFFEFGELAMDLMALLCGRLCKRKMRGPVNSVSFPPQHNTKPSF